MSAARGLAILGSTGSIGRSTLAVVALHPERFRVVVLGAHGSWQAVVEQARQHNAETVVLVDPEAAAQARAALRDCGSATRVECGADAMAASVAAANVDVVMAAIVGAAGLPSTLAACARLEARAARQQGGAGHGRRPADGRSAPRAHRDHSHRQRTQRDFSMHAGGPIFPAIPRAAWSA